MGDGLLLKVNDIRVGGRILESELRRYQVSVPTSNFASPPPVNNCYRIGVIHSVMQGWIKTCLIIRLHSFIGGHTIAHCYENEKGDISYRTHEFLRYKTLAKCVISKNSTSYLPDFKNNVTCFLTDAEGDYLEDCTITEQVGNSN